MNYLKFERSFRDFVVFSLSDIRTLYGNFDRRRLTEWQNKGYIRKIINGFYTFVDRKLDDDDLILIGSRIYNPAYISFETALSRYGLIPETVYGITCATTRKTNLFKTSIGAFTYRTIVPRIFFGYRILPHGGRLAYMEKSLLDYFYGNSDVSTPEDFESRRFNKEVFLELLDKVKLSKYLGRFNQKRLSKRITDFVTWCTHD